MLIFAPSFYRLPKPPLSAMTRNGTISAETYELLAWPHLVRGYGQYMSTTICQIEVLRIYLPEGDRLEELQQNAMGQAAAIPR